MRRAERVEELSLKLRRLSTKKHKQVEWQCRNYRRLSGKRHRQVEGS
jgi:hypothetical protein